MHFGAPPPSFLGCRPSGYFYHDLFMPSPLLSEHRPADYGGILPIAAQCRVTSMRFSPMNVNRLYGLRNDDQSTYRLVREDLFPPMLYGPGRKDIAADRQRSRGNAAPCKRYMSGESTASMNDKRTRRSGGLVSFAFSLA